MRRTVLLVAASVILAIILAGVAYALTINETQITTDINDQYGAVISGNKIVWEDFRSGYWDIYMCSASGSVDPDTGDDK